MPPGSIPAYAGDPAYGTLSHCHIAVYPRLRGGSRLGYMFGTAQRGLSPPTRGIRRLSDFVSNLPRSIPAYAGDPRPVSLDYRNLRVYPRLRGGSSRFIDARSTAPGLSPPTRGIQRLRQSPKRVRRSIPAYAGDPRASLGWQRLCAVYPRLRGGSSLSPRMR